ncbi:MAG: hypothetical protein PHQ60_15910, partial [Sideroxydans sp.]|nr:hypothetical protein [Sideroxydans sp.]
LEGESVMDASRLRRESGSLCHSFHGLTRVMAVAVQGFQAYFDVLVLVINIFGYGEDRRDLCTALGGEAFSTVKRRSPALPGFFHGKYFDAVSSMVTRGESRDCSISQSH